MTKSQQLNLSAFKQALHSLKLAIDQPKNEFIRDSVIQRFEHTFELTWKSIKRYFSINQALEETNIRNLFREAGKQNLISSVESWFEYHKARNLTSHTYNQKTAEEVCTAACNFYPHAKELLDNLEKLID